MFEKRIGVLLMLKALVLVLAGCDLLFGAAPVADIMASPTSGKPPLTVIFDASKSFDPDGSITQYRWEFGDGSWANGVKVTHTYAGAGIFTVTLKVTDNSGKTAKAQMLIKILSFTRADLKAGERPWGLIAADLNGDGDIDLGVVNQAGDDARIYLNRGDGGFESKDFRVGDAPTAIVGADFDNDHILDLAVANLNDSTVAVLLGNGDGTFKKPVTFEVGKGPIAITYADFNRDGIIDLATVNDFSDDVAIRVGNGDGTFKKILATREEFREGAGRNLKAITTADFDQDGIIDLITANQDSDDLSLFLGDGSGRFRRAINFGAGDGPVAITAADLNGDGTMDLATANIKGKDVVVRLGIRVVGGKVNFEPAAHFPAGDAPIALISADIDGDGLLDLITANRDGDNISILLGRGGGCFEPAIHFDVGDGPAALATADFNNDGRMDLAVTNADGDTISLLLNTTPSVSKSAKPSDLRSLQ